MSVELVLWTPILIGFVSLVADAAIAMRAQQDFYNVARDTSRMVALGQRSTEEAAAYAFERLSSVDELTVNVSIDNNFVETAIAAPASNYTSFVNFFGGDDLTAEVSMWIENYEGA